MCVCTCISLRTPGRCVWWGSPHAGCGWSPSCPSSAAAGSTAPGQTSAQQTCSVYFVIMYRMSDFDSIYFGFCGISVLKRCFRLGSYLQLKYLCNFLSAAKECKSGGVFILSSHAVWVATLIPAGDKSPIQSSSAPTQTIMQMPTPAAPSSH